MLAMLRCAWGRESQALQPSVQEREFDCRQTGLGYREGLLEKRRKGNILYTKTYNESPNLSVFTN